MRKDHPEQLEALQRLAAKLEREWWWINGALHAIAQINAEGPGTLSALRHQARAIDARRVAIAVRLAELTGDGKSPNGQWPKGQGNRDHRSPL